MAVMLPAFSMLPLPYLAATVPGSLGHVAAIPCSLHVGLMQGEECTEDPGLVPWEENAEDPGLVPGEASVEDPGLVG